MEEKKSNREMCRNAAPATQLGIVELYFHLAGLMLLRPREREKKRNV